MDLLADLSAHGENAALTNDLFAYSPDLSAHEIVFAIVGIYPERHVIDGTEGAALDSFVQNGGRLYLEGGDCFNEDPDDLGGYGVRPVFGLQDGPGPGTAGTARGVACRRASTSACSRREGRASVGE